MWFTFGKEFNYSFFCTLFKEIVQNICNYVQNRYNDNALERYSKKCKLYKTYLHHCYQVRVN
jgi:hypothetical protein